MGRGLLLSSVLDFCLDPNFFILMRRITKETSARRNTGLSMLALAWPLLSHYRTSDNFFTSVHSGLGILGSVGSSLSLNADTKLGSMKVA